MAIPNPFWAIVGVEQQTKTITVLGMAKECSYADAIRIGIDRAGENTSSVDAFNLAHAPARTRANMRDWLVANGESLDEANEVVQVLCKKLAQVFAHPSGDANENCAPPGEARG